MAKLASVKQLQRGHVQLNCVRVQGVKDKDVFYYIYYYLLCILFYSQTLLLNQIGLYKTICIIYIFEFKAAYVMHVLKRTAKASNHSRALYHVNQSHSVQEPLGRVVVNVSTNHNTTICQQTPPLATRTRVRSFPHNELPGCAQALIFYSE